MDENKISIKLLQLLQHQLCDDMLVPKYDSVVEDRQKKTLFYIRKFLYTLSFTANWTKRATFVSGIILKANERPPGVVLDCPILPVNQ